MNQAVTIDTVAPEEAIPMLLDRYGDKLYRLGIRECGSEDEALDLLQDTFTIAFRKWSQFEGRSAPSSWLYSIAVRVCRRRHRRRSGEPAQMQSLDELLPARGEPIAVVPESDDPQRAVVEREAREAVEEGIAQLPSTYRLPLVLKEIAELSVAEVAEVLGLKEATVKTRLHRARLKLRTELERILPRAVIPPADHSRQICIDLLAGKLEAMNRGVEYPLPNAELCTRCSAFFDGLDLAQRACVDLGQGEMPPAVRAILEREFGSESG